MQGAMGNRKAPGGGRDAPEQRGFSDDGGRGANRWKTLQADARSVRS
jgi:hypothetical protein